MRLRTKLLILLTVTALLPFFLLRTADWLAMRHLGQKVSESARQQVISETEQGLARVVEAVAVLMDREGLVYQLLLREQAKEVERLLAGPVPDDAGPVYGPRDFHPGGPAPVRLSLVPSATHGRVRDSGEVQPIKVSFDHPVALLLPGADRDAMTDQAKRLHGLLPTLRDARTNFPNGLLWQYTTLTDGLHFSYPGKMQYPEGYKPRERTWFRNTIGPQPLSSHPSGQVWSAPTFDASTRQVVVTVSQAVHGPGGAVVGVTAIDIPMGNLLDNTPLGEDWSRHMRLMIVSLEPREAVLADIPAAQAIASDRLPVVFTDTDQIQTPKGEREDIELTLLDLGDATAQATVLADMAEYRAGLVHAELKGEPTVIAYGPIQGPTPMAVVVAAPLSLISENAAALETEVTNLTWDMLVRTEYIALLIMLGVLFAAWRGSRSVTRPVTKLADAANRLADGDLHTSTDAGDRRDELGDLGRAFNTMVPKLRDHLAVREALEVAQEVQQSLMPRKAPKLPGVDIAGLSDYCDETGGDYFDYLKFDTLGDHRVGVALGDVTGHGVGAALLMATARALLRARAALPGTLVELVTAVNQHLCASRFEAKFMTLFYLLVEAEPDAMRVRWISAGHDPAIVYDPRHDTFEDWAGSDIPLGVLPTWEFHEFEKTLPDAAGSGRVVVLGTDGIWEAREPGRTMYGKPRLNDVIRRHAAEPAQAIAAAILADVHRFRGSHEQLDDITLVVLKFV